MTSLYGLHQNQARPRAATTACRACGAATVLGLTDSGLVTLCWPHPTTAWGEFDALMRGLRTYTLAGDQLHYRTPGTITYRPPDEATVLVEHQCTDPAPEMRPDKRRAHIVVRDLPVNAPAPF